MAIQIQLRQGTTTEHNTFTGAVGEVTVDTTKKALVLHDGVTAGGKPLPTLESGKVPVNQLSDATTSAKGVVRLATGSDITNTSDTAVVTPKNVSDMLVGIGSLAKGFRALFSARLTQMAGTNTSNNNTITATITSHGLVVGDLIMVTYGSKEVFGATSSQTITTTVTSVPNTDTFVFTGVGYGYGGPYSCNLHYVIKNNFNINSLTINAVGRYTLAIGTASGIIGTNFIPLVTATTSDNSPILVQPEVITSATSLTVRTFDKTGAAITPQWLHIGVAQ